MNTYKIAYTREDSELQGARTVKADKMETENLNAVFYVKNEVVAVIPLVSVLSIHKTGAQMQRAA